MAEYNNPNRNSQRPLEAKPTQLKTVSTFYHEISLGLYHPFKDEVAAHLAPILGEECGIDTHTGVSLVLTNCPFDYPDVENEILDFIHKKTINAQKWLKATEGEWVG